MKPDIAYGTAKFSDDESRRYRLTRGWYGAKYAERLGFMLLNPSKAGAEKNDPTVRKCCGFAFRWGFSGIVIGNLIPIISTDPSHLPPWSGLFYDNEAYVKQMIEECPIVCVAWGAVDKYVARTTALVEHKLRFYQIVKDIGRDLHCIGLTVSGHPLHPSRTPYTDFPVPFDWEPER